MFQLSEYKVSFRHDRADLVEQDDNNNCKAQNGSTLCMISNVETGNLISFGWHTCQKLGCFNKNIQRKEALKHALQKFEREIRTEFWSTYFEVRGKVN